MRINDTDKITVDISLSTQVLLLYSLVFSVRFCIPAYIKSCFSTTKKVNRFAINFARFASRTRISGGIFYTAALSMVVPCPHYRCFITCARLCLCASYSRIEEATAAFNDSTLPSIGILRYASAHCAVSSLNPALSFPIRNAVPLQ